VVGVLREEGHGARRALVCGLCLTEWDYLRVVCAGCGEQRFESLPVFTAEQFPHVRIEACDTCRTYLKTIDLTKDGRAVPVVDDIASISLDLWARDRGYTRLRASLVRT
jgi:FdhE protein